MVKFSHEQFLRDRNEALLSMDLAKMLAYMDKYEIPRPSSQEVLVLGMHKARTACTQLPMQERSKSKRWLLEHGSQSMDDGDVPI